MQAALRLITEVQPGGKIEVIDAQLPDGVPVEVIVLLPSTPAVPRRSILAVLADAPGHLAFQTAEEVDAYLKRERDAWER
ncbi:hypothetical protein [Candidatus Viridilinea mediisalina]|uniref:DUF104 domain-containing protein n=1 Tax=Candidatus Viridilinea mediisalina TaxID=2024553 RepID=A0A2A6RK56_9CHLR|nr:hypothetical protein [Candidatus Viridilinea mediisalina]PDW03333.1 hypothetical protein CJ255_09480 [Candidatus Viridilinea mediisalina]